jgi:exosome complex RNA-binding protein Rrp42 (RNase PH superfamily)
MDSVLAAIDAKMVKPAADRPYEGMISIHSEISPMASSEYEQGRYVCLMHQVSPGLGSDL